MSWQEYEDAHAFLVGMRTERTIVAHHVLSQSIGRTYVRFSGTEPMSGGLLCGFLVRRIFASYHRYRAQASFPESPAYVIQ
jgi:hypothetical protein